MAFVVDGNSYIVFADPVQINGPLDCQETGNPLRFVPVMFYAMGTEDMPC